MDIGYTFRKAKFMQPTLRGYWVTLYLIFDGERTYTFYDQETWLDNALLMSESCSVQSFTQQILVTPDSFSSIYKQISDFENVLESDTN